MNKIQHVEKRRRNRVNQALAKEQSALRKGQRTAVKIYNHERVVFETARDNLFQEHRAHWLVAQYGTEEAEIQRNSIFDPSPARNLTATFERLVKAEADANVRLARAHLDRTDRSLIESQQKATKWLLMCIFVYARQSLWHWQRLAHQRSAIWNGLRIFRTP